MSLRNTMRACLAAGVMAVLIPNPARAATIVATKDATAGQYNSPPENTNFASGDGNLELLSFSGAKLSALIGGFDVSQFSDVTSAKLNIYYLSKTGQNSNTGGSLGAQAVTIPWDEATPTLVTDLNLRTSPHDGLVQAGFSTTGQNVIGGENYVWGSNGTKNVWLEIDVTEIVANWVNGTVGSGDQGILLTGGVWSGLVTIASTETSGDFAPYLTVEGTAVPEASTLTLAGIAALLTFRRRA